MRHHRSIPSLALLALLTAACGSGGGDDEPELSPCQEAAQCVVDECAALDDWAMCIEDGNTSPFCQDAEVMLYQCGQIECDAGSPEVGKALALTTDAYDGQVCE